MSREFDVIVFGASGFTGQFVVEELARTIQREDQRIKWAVSGRNKFKLRKVLELASKQVGEDLRQIAAIEADVSDSQSLVNLCRRTRVLINCVGPYTLFGEQVIKACLEASTHQIDVSGEPLYLESVQLNYHEDAKKKGVYFIGCCGFIAFTNDFGVEFLKKNFDGQLNSVESFGKLNKHPQVNVGTLDSAIKIIENFGKWRKVNKQLYQEVLYKTPPKNNNHLSKRFLPFRSRLADGWGLYFPSIDILVIQRTQRFRYQEYGQNPTQFESYIVANSFFEMIKFIIMGIVLVFFLLTPPGRRLLLRYPDCLTFGAFRKEGVDRKELEDGNFEVFLVGRGWDKKSVEKLYMQAVKNKPNKTVVAKVTGGEPGYLATSSFLVQSALTILKESDKMPGTGGVLTPGSAFIDTNILDGLGKSGITFKIVEKS